MARAGSVWPSLAISILTAAVFTAATLGAATRADAQDRTLTFEQTHTGERITVTYMRNGRRDPQAMRQINHIMRDWRRNEATEMDPRLIDIIWEARRLAGSNAPVQILSGYRSPVTNAQLRQRSRGVAQNSQHTVGRALDFRLPDVPVSRLREIALKMQRGGVGFYASSGFVHMDTGSVRHWPRLSRQQLTNLFPDGKTVHLPADGRPLAGYEAAKAELARGRTQVASASSSQRPRGLLATLFGGGGGSGQQQASAPEQPVASSPQPQQARAPSAPQPAAAPAPQPAAAPEPQARETVVAAAPAPLPRPRPEIEVPAEIEPAMAMAAAPMPLPRPERESTETAPLQTASIAGVLPRERPILSRPQPARGQPGLSPEAREAAMALAPSPASDDALPFSATFTESHRRLGQEPAFFAIDTRAAAMRAHTTPHGSARAPALAGMHHPDQSDVANLMGSVERVIVNRFEKTAYASPAATFHGNAIEALPMRSYRLTGRLPQRPVAAALGPVTR